MRVVRRGQMVLSKAVREALGVKEGITFWWRWKETGSSLNPPPPWSGKAWAFFAVPGAKGSLPTSKGSGKLGRSGARVSFPSQTDWVRHRPFHLPPGGNGALFPVHRETFHRHNCDEDGINNTKTVVGFDRAGRSSCSRLDWRFLGFESNG